MLVPEYPFLRKIAVAASRIARRLRADRRSSRVSVDALGTGAVTTLEY